MAAIKQLEIKVRGNLQDAVDAFGLEAVLLILAEIAEEIGADEQSDEWLTAAEEIDTLADALDFPDPE